MIIGKTNIQIKITNWIKPEINIKAGGIFSGIIVSIHSSFFNERTTYGA